jgi:hypothetical protein
VEYRVHVLTANAREVLDELESQKLSSGLFVPQSLLNDDYALFWSILREKYAEGLEVII